MGIQITQPEALVSAEWLAGHLGDRNLRIFDCSTVLEFTPEGSRPYKVVNCAEDHARGHIPGAGYFDLQQDFSDDDSPYGMTLADLSKVRNSFERAGVGDGTRVVLYSRRGLAWATRFWWMLRWLGFDDAAVLDGGWERWQMLELPIETRQAGYPPGSLTLRPRPEIFVGKEDVLAAVGDGEICTINALGRDIHSGEIARYGRPGRIAGSVNVPQAELVDADTGLFLRPQEIAAKFRKVGADKAARHICYCGGAIFATVDAFWLHRLGHGDVAVYENSMSEWGSDETLPMERD